MATRTKIIPLKRQTVTRRTLTLTVGPRPDIQSVLDMLNDIDPALLTREATQSTAPQVGASAPSVTGNSRMPVPPAPANGTPHLPGPDTDARARALSALVFPEGSSCILTCTLPRFRFTSCLS